MAYVNTGSKLLMKDNSVTLKFYRCVKSSHFKIKDRALQENLSTTEIKSSQTLFLKRKPLIGILRLGQNHPVFKNIIRILFSLSSYLCHIFQQLPVLRCS